MVVCSTACKGWRPPQGSVVPFAARSLLLATTLLASTSAMASSPTLLAVGTLPDSSAGAGVDLSGLTGTLENGLPQNILGGLGSALAWAGGNTFLALPDRGPNATSYNRAVDNT